jgi:hypothetical protein
MGTIAGLEDWVIPFDLDPVISAQERKHAAISRGPSAPGAQRRALSASIPQSHPNLKDAVCKLAIL